MYLMFIARLLFDRRIPGVLRMLVLLSWLYSLFPRTWLWGPWDNLVFLIASMALLFLLSPRAVLREHWSGRNAKSKTNSPIGDKGKVVDAKYRFVDEDKNET